MPRFTAAYSSLSTRLTEVNALRKLANEKEKADAIKHATDINALCRGGIVLLCSHIEGYVKEIGEVALDSLHSKGVVRTNISSKFFYHISKKEIDEIRDTTDHERVAEKIFSFLASDQPYWSRTGSFPSPIPAEKFNQGFSNPAYKKICTYFNRFGYSEYSSDLGNRLNAEYLPVINMVDHIVDTRNKIAHGDPAATKTPSEVQDMTKLAQNFCAATDSVFATWWRRNFCAIR